MKPTRAILLLSVLLAAAGSFLATSLQQRALAGRTTAGDYVLPSGNPVQTGTTITSTWANTTMSDIGTALTNSLDRTGTGYMSGALKLYAGSISSPGLTFASEPSTGLYRFASHNIRMSINSTDNQVWADNSSEIKGKLQVGSGGDIDGGSFYTLDVFNRIQPISPAPGNSAFPLGNDLWLIANGSADLRLQTWMVSLSSSTAVASPGSVQVTVGSTSTLCPSTATSDPNCKSLTGSTAKLCRPGSGAFACGLAINRGLSDEEIIASTDWTLDSTTKLTATFAKTHTAPFSITQLGAVALDTRAVLVNTSDDSDRGVGFYDKQGVSELTLSNDTGGTFPYNTIQVTAPVSGNNSPYADGGGGNFVYRNRTPASCFQFVSSNNKASFVNACEIAATGAGGARVDGFLTMGGAYTDGGLQYSTIQMVNSPDIGRIFGGGFNEGLIVYASQGGADAGGSFHVRNNQLNETDVFVVDTTARTTALAGASTTTGTDTALGFVCTGSTHCGTLTLDGFTGSGTVSVVSGCHPICTNTTATAGVQCSVSGTTLSIQAGNGNHINYFCF